MNRIILACLLATASLSAAASQRQPVDVGGAAVARGGEIICSNDRACDDGVYCNGTETCQKPNPLSRRGRCVAGTPPCREGDRCLEEQDRCRTGPCDVPDADGDGYAAIACGGNDCDDTDPDRSPGLTEICDAQGIDEDCDVTTVGDTDLDGDGYIDARCL